MRILVTGATGYVGSRLIPSLVEAGHEVVAAIRSSGDIDAFAWAGDVSTRIFDIEDDALVESATAGVDAVVYLVHSMAVGDFVARDREAAGRVARACVSNGVARVVYLSGLVPDGDLSDHLRSRLEVEEVFLGSEVPAVVLRAAMVIGSGSTSFEILRRMTERVPFTPIPSWMRSTLQPVAIEDVVHLIGGTLEGKPRNGHYDVGGDEVVSYPELLALFARVAGLRRQQFVVPFVPRPVVGAVVAALTGMSRATVSALVDSLSHDMVCQEDEARQHFADPDHDFMALVEALERSLGVSHDATSAEGDIQAGAATDPEWAGGVTEIEEGGRAVQKPRSLVGTILLGVPVALVQRMRPRDLI